MNYHTPIDLGNVLDNQAVAGQGTFTIWYYCEDVGFVRSISVNGIRTARVTYDALVAEGYMMHNTRP